MTITLNVRSVNVILLVLNTVVRVFLTNPVTKRSVNSFTATPVNKKEPSGCNIPGLRLLSMINMTEKVPEEDRGLQTDKNEGTTEGQQRGNKLWRT